MVPGVWVRVVARRALGKGNWAAGPPALAPLAPGVCPVASQRPAFCHSPSRLLLPDPAATLHRLGLWGPPPGGRGPMGPPLWWDLSPAVATRLHLLASLSGGGLAWRTGDRRWLAGEGKVGWALGLQGLGGPCLLGVGVRAHLLRRGEGLVTAAVCSAQLEGGLAVFLPCPCPAACQLPVQSKLKAALHLPEPCLRPGALGPLTSPGCLDQSAPSSDQKVLEDRPGLWILGGWDSGPAPSRPHTDLGSDPLPYHR